jgi:putative membrane protein
LRASAVSRRLGVAASVTVAQELLMYRSQPRRPLATSTILLAAFAACSSTSQPGSLTPSGPTTHAGISVRDDAQIFGALHVSNVGEITAAMTAQQKAANESVKSFASMMVTEHSSLDQQGNALAQQLGVTASQPDSALNVQQRNEADALRAAPAGAQFDRLYISQQIADHQRTLNLVDNSIAAAQRAELKTALQSQVRPAVAQHLARARQIHASLGSAPNASAGAAGSNSMSPSDAAAGSSSSSGTSGTGTKP